MTLEAGTKLGRYEIRTKLGAGGMGEVYLATDTRLARRVALKTLPAEFTNDNERLKRFQHEARAASALNHPNLLTIHEIGSAAGAQFIATEFVDGQTLRDIVKCGETNLDQALDVAQQTAFALTAAHGAGIIHRDIKPENIMLRRDGIVKVLDFGLAKLLEDHARDMVDPEADTRALVLTDAGRVLGTPQYMSPEQARGLDLDARTDLWSLGVVLYEMLAGQPPFHGETKSHVLVSILEAEPPPLTKFAPDTPPEMERIVRKALTKDRDSRYQTARDLMIDLKNLRRALDIQSEVQRFGAPVGASDAGGHSQEVARSDADSRSSKHGTTLVEQRATARDAPASHRSRRYLATAVIAMIILMVGLGGWYYFNHQKTASTSIGPIQSIAVMPFINGSGNNDVDYLSDGMTESLITSLSQISKVSVKARTSVFRYKNQETPPKQIGRELSVQAIVNGRVAQRGNNLTLHIELVDVNTETALWSADYNRPMTDLVSLQSELVRDISSKLELKLSSVDEQKLAKKYTTNVEAYKLYLQGRHSLNQYTEESLKRSIDYFNQATRIDPGYALAYSGIADAYHWLSSMYLPPIEASPKAKAAAMSALELDPTLAEAHVSLALVLSMYEWKWVEAEPEFRRAIELNPNYATAHHWYGRYLALNKRTREAIAEMERARELDPLSLLIATDCAWPYFFAGEYDKAIDHFNQALALDKNFMVSYWVRGWASQEKGDLSGAIADYKKAQSLEDAAIIRGFLANAYAFSGKSDEARRLLNGLLDLEKRQYVSGACIASVYAALGDKKQALVWLDRAAQNHDEWMVWLKYDHRFKSLLSDPQFVELARLVGLPE